MPICPDRVSISTEFEQSGSPRFGLVAQIRGTSRGKLTLVKRVSINVST